MVKAAVLKSPRAGGVKPQQRWWDMETDCERDDDSASDSDSDDVFDCGWYNGVDSANPCEAEDNEMDTEPVNNYYSNPSVSQVDLYTDIEHSRKGLSKVNHTQVSISAQSMIETYQEEPTGQETKVMTAEFAGKEEVACVTLQGNLDGSAIVFQEFPREESCTLTFVTQDEYERYFRTSYQR